MFKKRVNFIKPYKQYQLKIKYNIKIQFVTLKYNAVNAVMLKLAITN